MSFMDIDNFENYARELAQKSIQSFTFLGFSSLALSIQFSPGLGHLYLNLLFLSWILLLISSFAGGWIILKIPVFYRINVAKIRVEEYIKGLNNPEFQKAINYGAAHPPDGTKWSQEMLESTFKAEQAKVELGDANLKKIERVLPFVHHLQTWSFLLGISGNLMFAIINLSSGKN